MALNKKIILKVREKTVNESALGDFLMELLEFESEARGWFTADYNAILEKNCKGEEQDANN